MSGPLRYLLAEDGLEVRLGPWCVRRIAYLDMEGVAPGYVLWNEHWTNPWPWRFLTIRRRSGWFRNFLINPSESEEFQRELAVRIEKVKR